MVGFRPPSSWSSCSMLCLAVAWALGGCALDHSGVGPGDGSGDAGADVDAGVDAGGMCTPTTCAALGAQCGVLDDGCGTALRCPDCPAGMTCGADGMRNRCGVGTCMPSTDCGTAECGTIDDGCGGPLDCGMCAGRAVCGALEANRCCTIADCATLGATCGDHDDGCAGIVSCGACDPTQQCSPTTLACGPCLGDATEPADSRGTPYDFTDVVDSPDHGPEVFGEFDIHHDTDEDWFRFEVTDIRDGTLPRVTVRLDDVAPENDIELYVYFRCTDGSAATRTCWSGGSFSETVPGSNNDFFGCFSNNPTGRSEEISASVSGCGGITRVWIRLFVYNRRWGSCAPYTLTRTIT